jgi:hypothetical protein
MYCAHPSTFRYQAEPERYLIEAFGAPASLDPHLRQQRALLLTKFRFRRSPVGRSFSNAGVRRDRLLQRIVDRKTALATG